MHLCFMPVMRSVRVPAARFPLAIAIAVAACGEPTATKEGAGASLLIYSRRAQGDGLYVISTDGSRVTPVSVPGLAVPIETRDFDWSPDGARVAFFNGAQLYVADITGGQLRQLTSGPAQMSRYPTWSPDGSMLVYATREVTSWDLRVVRADGSGQRRLDSSDLTTGGRASWSPDGARIVFAKDELRFNSGDIQVITALYITDVTPGEIATRLASPGSCNDSDPAWSPDGTAIAFAGCRDGIGGIFTMRPDGTGLRRVTTAPGSPDRFPSWSPAGDRLAFERGPPENRDVFTVALDGTDVVNLTASNRDFDGAPKWRKR